MAYGSGEYICRVLSSEPVKGYGWRAEFEVLERLGDPGKNWQHSSITTSLTYGDRMYGDLVARSSTGKKVKIYLRNIAPRGICPRSEAVLDSFAYILGGIEPVEEPVHDAMWPWTPEDWQRLQALKGLGSPQVDSH